MESFRDRLARLSGVRFLLVVLTLSFSSSVFAQMGTESKKVAGDLEVHEIELSAVIEGISKNWGKIILPNEKLLPQLKNRTATVIFPPNMEDMKSNKELWEHIFNNVLSIYGYTLVKKGEFYRLMPITDIHKYPTPFFKDRRPLDEYSEKIITQVITLNNIDAMQVSKLFPRVSQVKTPDVLPDGKTLVVTAFESMLKNFVELVEMLDVPDTDVPQMKVFQLKRASASQVRTQILSYFNNLKALKKGRIPASAQPFILADDRLNRMAVFIEDERYLAVIEELKDFFDGETKGKIFRPIHIYRLQNSDAKVVADNLSKILQTKGTKKGANTVDPTIVPFVELNALIISVDRRETYDAIREVIKQIDVRRNQVYISSSIVEVGASSNFNVGVETAGRLKPERGKLGAIGGTGFGLSALTYDVTNQNNPVTRTPSIPSSGLSMALAYGSYDLIPFVLEAAASDNSVNVLATPVIMCDDNEKAMIEINEERAFTTSTIGSGGQQTNTFGGFHKAGISLSIKPTISSDRFLKLEIDQRVDRFIPDPSGGDRDVKSTRHASTSATVRNKTSVVIGGLTQKERNQSSSRVPMLSKIPVLGHLFKSKGDTNSESTLYFFITPEIVSNFQQISDKTDELYDRIERHEGNLLRSEGDFKQIRNEGSDRMRELLNLDSTGDMKIEIEDSSDENDLNVESIEGGLSDDDDDYIGGYSVPSYEEVPEGATEVEGVPQETPESMPETDAAPAEPVQPSVVPMPEGMDDVPAIEGGGDGSTFFKPDNFSLKNEGNVARLQP